MSKITRYLICLICFLMAAAVSSAAIPPPFTLIQSGQVTIISGDSNNNGKIENNKEGVFKIALTNNQYSLNKIYSVTASISTTKTGVTITDSAASYGDIDVGVTKSPTDNGFTFRGPSTYTGSITFNISVSYKNEKGTSYTLAEPLTVNIVLERSSGASSSSTTLSLMQGASSTSQGVQNSDNISQQGVMEAADPDSIYKIAIEDENMRPIGPKTLRGGEQIKVLIRGYGAKGNYVGLVDSLVRMTDNLGDVAQADAGIAEIKAKRRGTCYITAYDQYGHSVAAGPVIVLDSSEPVCSYGFDEGVGDVINDESFNGNNGRLGRAHWTQGIRASAIEFEKNGSQINFGHAKILNTRDQFSIAMFIKPSEDNNMVDNLVIKNGQYALALESLRFRAVFSINGKSYTLKSRTRLSAGEWHHVVVTFDGRYARIYIDGKLNMSMMASGRIDDGSKSDLLVGDMTGAVDDIRIYDKALSPYEITDIVSFGYLSLRPATPLRPDGPFSVIQGSETIFSLTPLPYDKQIVKYVLDWGDNTTSVTAYGSSKEVTRVAHRWERSADRYNIRVKAIDKSGPEGYWSNEAWLSVLPRKNIAPRILALLDVITLRSNEWKRIPLSAQAGSIENEGAGGLLWLVEGYNPLRLDCYISYESGVAILNIRAIQNAEFSDSATVTVIDSCGLTASQKLSIRVSDR